MVVVMLRDGWRMDHSTASQKEMFCRRRRENMGIGNYHKCKCEDDGGPPPILNSQNGAW